MSILQMEERLWDYIDGACNEEEMASISGLLHSSSAWKEKYDELLKLNALLNSSALEQPSMRFTQNVMEEIARYQIAPATRTYINKKVIYGLAGFFLTMLAGLIIYFIAQVARSEGSSQTSFGADISQVRWSQLVNNTYINIFLMVNVVLGLMLLDRYLNSKKTALKQKNS